jgi:1-acyl-sn-glycerol-3-phosphate acyltransferase
MATDVLEDLIRTNTKDMLESFGLGHVRRWRPLLAACCYWPARRFALTVLEFDRRVACDGLRLAAQWSLQEFAATVNLQGSEHLPPYGPVLLVSNHPGITDTLALFAAIRRTDLQTVAAVRPFLTALENMTRHLIYVDEEANAHLGVVRRVTRHLREGGCVLTFPAGRIEPDPSVQEGASAALEEWSDSIGLFSRLAPEAQIVPVLVSGVFSARALRSLPVRVRRNQADRERFAAMLQVVAPRLYPVRVTVAIGRPLPPANLLARSSSSGIKEAVVKEMRRLLETSPGRLQR